MVTTIEEQLQEQLWKEFNLRESNPARGGGIMYSMRYSKERLEAHQEQVIAALREMGAQIVSRGDELGIKLDNPQPSRRVFALAEELSVISDALAYKQSWVGECKNIFEISCGLGADYANAALRGDLSGAYAIRDGVLPELLADLKTNLKQGMKFSKLDKQCISMLEDMTKTEIEWSPRGYKIVRAK